MMIQLEIAFQLEKIASTLKTISVDSEEITKYLLNKKN